MKKIVAILATLFLSVSALWAQEEKPVIPTLNAENDQFEYKYVGEFNGSEISAQAAFERVLKYVYRTLQTDKSKVVADESKHDEIIFDCSLKAQPLKGFGFAINTAYYTFKLNIQFKEGKCRLFFNDFLYNFIMDNGQGQQFYSQDFGKLKNNKAAKKIKAELSGMLYQIQDDVFKSINGIETSTSKKEDW